MWKQVNPCLNTGQTQIPSVLRIIKVSNAAGSCVKLLVENVSANFESLYWTIKSLRLTTCRLSVLTSAILLLLTAIKLRHSSADVVASSRPLFPHLNVFRQGSLAHLWSPHTSDTKHKHTWELPSTTTVLYYWSLSSFSGAAEGYVPCLRAVLR